MPVAEPFAFYGAINTIPLSNAQVGSLGIPRNIGKVDVSSYDRWITLSGVNKDNVGSFNAQSLSEKIIESYKLAVQVYWNFAQVLGEVYAERPDVDILKRIDFGLTPAPIQRSNGDNLFTVEEEFEFPSVVKRLINIGINKFYNGDTDDEDNFVGYGLGLNEIIDFSSGLFGSPNAAVIRLFSARLQEILPSSSRVLEYEYIELGGYHFLCEAFARNIGGSGGVITFSDGEITAEIETEINGEDYIARSKITGLDFYTYA
jgi:hypothetical protein